MEQDIEIYSTKNQYGESDSKLELIQIRDKQNENWTTTTTTQATCEE